MPYKTILVHVDDSRNAENRFRLAASVAKAHSAHLVGLATTGVTRFIYETVTVDPGDPQTAPYIDILRQRAEVALTKLAQVAHTFGVSSVEPQMTDDDAARGLNLQARYCDLLIMGQYDPDEPNTSLEADVPETVALGCGCPLLFVPSAGSFAQVGANVLVGWNASVEAGRALRGALPFIAAANSVKVALFEEALPEKVRQKAGDAITAYLAQHQVRAEVLYRHAVGDIGDGLLSLAEEIHADLLVMGCYTHSRIREIVLGGATRTVLKSMTLPVLMSH